MNISTGSQVIARRKIKARPLEGSSNMPRGVGSITIAAQCEGTIESFSKERPDFVIVVFKCRGRARPRVEISQEQILPA